MNPTTTLIHADTLVTGATGFLGRWLVAALTSDGRRVVAVARSAESRRAQLAAFVDSHGGDASNLVMVEGDLKSDGLGIRERFEGVRDVFHLGAVFAFGMKLDEAREVNVLGALRVGEWAREQPELRRLVHLAGYRSTVPPTWLPAKSYPLSAALSSRLYKEHGAYEASKLESYLALRQFATTHALPYSAVHPSTVIGHSKTGETSQVTGLGEIVEKLWNGKLPALVGTSKTNVPLVSVDYLASFLSSVPLREESLGQDLCVLDPETPRLPELVSTIAAHLGVKAPTRLVSARVLAHLPKALTGVERESLTFLTEDVYDTTSAESHAQAVGLERPPIRLAITRWADHLVSTDFGRAPNNERGRHVEMDGSQTFVVGGPSSDAVLLHGLPWDSESMAPLSHVLPFTTMRADLPGMGRSSPDPNSDLHWLASLLETQQEPVTLIGHSYSSGLALRLAKNHPEKVRELILISPFFLQERAPWFLRLPFATSQLLRSSNASQLQNRFTRLGATDAVHSAVQSAHNSLRHLGVAKAAAQRLAKASEMSERAELMQLLTTAAHPMLLVHGELDTIHEVACHADVVSIPGAGHSPHVDAPVRVAAAIERWRQAARAGF